MVWGWSGGAMVWGWSGKLPVPGRPTNLDQSVLQFGLQLGKGLLHLQ